jgi:hypothetical protein
MARKSKEAPKWPKKLLKQDELFALYDNNSNLLYLIYASADKKATFMRDNGKWIRVSHEFFERVSDQAAYSEEVGISFIAKFDREEELEDAKTRDSRASTAYRMRKKPPKRGVVAAAEGECPPATQDIALNLKNRENAITVAKYGPLNPKEPNEKFWAEKSERWSVTVEEAKKSLCGNCAVFIITTDMKDCIAGGLESGGSSSQNAWDAIDAAELGYCEAFDFKCAASRTCDAWVTGGPITDEIQASRSAEK